MSYSISLSASLSDRAWNNIYKLSLIGFGFSVLASFWIEAGFHQRQNYVGSATIVQYISASAFMLLAWWSGQHRTQKQPDQSTFKNLLIFGVLLRLLLIPIDSYTSSDVSRYLFDGKLAYEGIDPYRTAHNAPAIQELKQQWAPPEEHAKYVTLYPPIALALFSISASTGIEYAELSWKLIVTAFSIATLLLGSSLLIKLDKRQYLPLLALSPLLIFESGIGAHLDTVSAFFVLCTIWAFVYKKVAVTGIFIALGTATKLLPLALMMPIGLLILFNMPFRNSLLIALTCSVSLLAIYGVTFLIGYHPIGSIGVFFEKWRFGSPVFDSLQALFPDDQLGLALAILFFSTLLILGVWIFKQHERQHSTLLTAGQYVMAIPLLLSPVLFPWYLMPLALLTALKPNLIVLSWILFAPLTYEVLDQFLCCSVWQPAQWPLTILMTVLFVTLIIKSGLFLLLNRTQGKNH